MDCDMEEVAGLVTEMALRVDNDVQTLASGSGNPKAEVTPRLDNDNDFQTLVQEATSNSPTIQYGAVKKITSILNTSTRSVPYAPNPTASALINCGVLPVLVNCLSSNSAPELQCDAAVAMIRISFGPSTDCHALVKAGAVPPLISLLSSPHITVREKALRVLGNVACDEPPLRDYVISMGIAQPLLNLMNTNTPIDFLREISWVLFTLCRSSSSPPPNTFFQEDILHAIRSLVHHEDVEVLQHAIWALGHIARIGKDQTQMIIDIGVLPQLVASLSHEDITVRSAAVQTIGNIVLWTDAQTQAVLNCGALQHFRNLLTTQQSNAILSTAACVLSNIAAGTLTQIQEVIDAQLIPLAINKVNKNERFISTEFAWIVRNIVGNIGNDEQVSYLISSGVLSPLSKLLSTSKSVILKGAVNDAVRALLFRIRAEEVQLARGQIAESIGPDKVDEFLQSIQCQGVPQNVQPIRRGYVVGGGGDLDDVFQNFQQLKLDF